MKRGSIATRDGLIAATSERYGASSRAEKETIIDELAASTRYHRTAIGQAFGAASVPAHLRSGRVRAVGSIGSRLSQAPEGNLPDASCD
jgi:hypothetical protein